MFHSGYLQISERRIGEKNDGNARGEAGNEGNMGNGGENAGNRVRIQEIKMGMR